MKQITINTVGLGVAALLIATTSAIAAEDKMEGKMMMPAMSPDEKMMMEKMMMGMTKDDKKMMSRAGMMMSGERRVKMMTAPNAGQAGLQGAAGFADVDVARGIVEIAVMLPNAVNLPAGSVLEGWLSTAGRKGGPGMSTASERDQKFGPAFGMADLASQSRDIPYALSTGLLRRVGTSQTYFGRFMIDNPLTPYAAVAVTVESDGNTGAYDPRPGSPLMDGMIMSGMMMGRDGKMMGGMMGGRMMMAMPDGRMMPMQMMGAKMMMTMPDNKMMEMKMMDGKMMMPTGMEDGKMMMVMPDGARMEVKMMDGKMMMAMPDGNMAEIKMDGMK